MTFFSSSLVVLVVILLWNVDYITSSILYDDLHPGFQFDNHPGYILFLPENMTKVEQMTNKVSSKIDCVFACVETSWCRSVNFKLSAEVDNRHICELLATDFYSNSEHLKLDENFTYLTIKNPCEEKPCQNIANCSVHYNRLNYLCQCGKGLTGDRCQKGINKDCSDIFKTGERRNGTYLIDPDNKGPFPVYCDMTTDGGGWTVFQRRQDGSVDFYLGWQKYKTGFGNLNGEFWLGNDYIERLTARTPSTLRVELEDWGGVGKYARYGSFSVGGESDKYRIKVGLYSGTAGDSLANQNNMFFTTKDQDNDERSNNCASVYTGAWWYRNCHTSNLNGRYLGNTVDARGICWQGFKNSYYSFRGSEMKTRPTTF